MSRNRLKNNAWIRSSILIAVAVLIAKVLGFVRDQIIAVSFGLTTETDAYYIAFNLLGGLFVSLGGAGAAFYMMTQKLIATAVAENNTGKAGWQVRRILGFYTIVSAVVMAVGYLNTSLIAGIIAPGASPELLAQIKLNLLWLMPLIVFTPAVGIMSGYIAIKGEDFLIGINSIYPSIAIILGVFWGTKIIGSAILAISTMTGSLLQVLALAPGFIRRMKTKTKGDTASFNRKKNIRISLEILVPVALSTLMGLVNFTVDMAFASGLSAGSASALSLSYKIMTVPVGIILTALLLPIFPLFTQLAIYKDWERLRYQYHLATDLYAFMIMLLATIIVALSVPITAILFNYGKFSQENLTLLSTTLMVLAPTMLLYGHRDILARLAYSLNLVRFVMFLSIFTIFLNWLFDWILVRYLGLNGIIISTLCVNIIYLLILYWVVTMVTKKILHINMLISHLKLVMIFAVVSFVGYQAYYYFHPHYDSFISNLFTIGVYGASITALFIILNELLIVRSGMIMNIIKKVARRG